MIKEEKKLALYLFVKRQEKSPMLAARHLFRYSYNENKNSNFTLYFRNLFSY